MYRKFNANLKEKGDCVVRAVSLAIDKTWEDTFKLLCDKAYELKDMPNSKETYGAILEDFGFKYVTYRAKKGEIRPKVYNFGENKKGSNYVLSLASHLVYHDGKDYFDTWDCGKKALYSYWVKD